MILLDTSVLIALARVNLPRGKWVSSAVVKAELEFGLVAAVDDSEFQRRQDRLALFGSTSLQWLPFVESTAQFHAELVDATRRHAPAKARAHDLMIAATAFEHGATLATLNPKDVRYVSHLVDVLVPSARAAPVATR